jgi:hypothetical protein
MTGWQNRLFKGQKQLFSIGIRINLTFIVALINEIYELIVKFSPPV